MVMDCERMRISCSIAELGETLTRWDWGAFISTTLATVVGAALSAAAAWFFFHRESRERRTTLEQERKERRSDAFTEAVAKVMGALGEHMAALKKYSADKAFADEAKEATFGAKDIRVRLPDVLEPSVQVQLALLRADTDERTVLDALEVALWGSTKEDAKVRYRATAKMVTALQKWRRGEVQAEETVKTLEKLPDSERVATAGSGGGGE